MATPKRQKSQKGAGKAAFDGAALSHLTASVEKVLAKKENYSRAAKRKRHDDENHAKTSKPPPPKQEPPAGGRRAVLLEEIRALGGDEGDLELVADLDSDDEQEPEVLEAKADSTVEASFKIELARFASGLGFDKAREDDAESEADEAGSEASEVGADEATADDDEVDNPGDDDAGVDATPPPTFVTATKSDSVEPREKSMDRKWAGKLSFEPRPDWHAAGQDGLPMPTSGDDGSSYSPAIARLKAHAQTLLDEDSTAYSAAVAKSSTHKFMATIVSSGTLSDKVSALTLAVQESPVHNIRAMETLLNMAGKKSRGQALAALGALVDLLGNGVVLPSDRRLRPFHAQPGLLGSLQRSSTSSWQEGQKLPGKITKPLLIMWAFEDWLKATYFKILGLLEVWSGDEIEYSRSKSLDFIFGLLRDKPEQEANLMRLLVSKLGDREGKIASRASYLLLQLLNTHPGMKPTVIQFVEQEVVFRPGTTMRTKYHAVNTLNQIILSSKEPAVADNLVRIYFELFLVLLKTGALGIFDRVRSADLNGEQGEISDKKHGKNKKPNGKHDSKGDKGDKLPAGDVAGNDQDVAQKLVTAVLTGVNRAIPFAMADESTLEKQIDTLFRITHSSNFNTGIQALILIQQLAASKNLAVDRFYRTLYESLLDPRLIASSKQTLYLNLLYRALKADADVRRVKAFVKRMLQVLTLHQPPFVCAVLFLVAELQATFPDLMALLNDPEEQDDDGEEMYKDVDPAGAETASTAAVEQKPRRSATSYDGRKRNPEFSNAHRSCLWELSPYFNHYHPSVVVFANNVLVRQELLPKPELANHTLIQFLDKFVFRNPKATDAKRGSSIMQPALAAASSAQTVAGGKAGLKLQPTVNSASFWNLKSQDVAAEDVFFHEYFASVGKAGQASSRASKRREKKRDGDDDDTEDAEDEIWQALVDSRPEIEGDDADADMGFSDDGCDADEGLAGLLEDISSDDDEDDDMEEEEGLDAEGSDGGVEFNDFSGSEAGPQKPKGAANRGRLRRKELKALPMFASVDDYADMLAQEQDDFDF